jgi:hypothetical protein
VTAASCQVEFLTEHRNLARDSAPIHTSALCDRIPASASAFPSLRSWSWLVPVAFLILCLRRFNTKSILSNDDKVALLT